MPLHYVEVCDVCGSEQRFERASDCSTSTHGYGWLVFCAECKAVEDLAMANLDHDLKAEIRRLRGLE